MSAIDAKYAALGGPRGFLGRPFDAGAGSREMNTSDNRGRCRDFEHGSIYWSAATGAHEVHGAIRDRWARMGWERSRLGYPVSDEQPTSDGGRVSRFQGGAIVWTRRGGTDVRFKID